MNVTTGGQRTRLVTAASYAVLFLLGVEYYTLLAGPPGPVGPSGRETDLFAQ